MTGLSKNEISKDFDKAKEMLHKINVSGEAFRKQPTVSTFLVKVHDQSAKTRVMYRKEGTKGLHQNM